ncbi:hypothetical protein L1F31_16380 [Brevibacterium spongiae]|uniref:Uncharacterized protein n=1 Tax=Brevibacterium spongiae TaxID=2909672 RepID=A0ABY5SM87_9MICO|nr:hypothetical protein [Brevibacterium spongiae]UVI35672.1 hypothetical protein L1F31_16380 [Brevibacterium spongiae]
MRSGGSVHEQNHSTAHIEPTGLKYSLRGFDRQVDLIKVAYTRLNFGEADFIPDGEKFFSEGCCGVEQAENIIDNSVPMRQHDTNPGLTVTEAVTTKDAFAQIDPAPPMSVEGASPDKPLPLRLTAKRGISIRIDEDNHRSISENSCKAHNEPATPSASARIMDDQRSATLVEHEPKHAEVGNRVKNRSNERVRQPRHPLTQPRSNVLRVRRPHPRRSAPQCSERFGLARPGHPGDDNERSDRSTARWAAFAPFEIPVEFPDAPVVASRRGC